jgi:20S proteasome subunit alpha 2
MSGADFSLTTFSPSGKLVQIEYALNAVASGKTSLGIKAVNGVILASEKKVPSILIDPDTIHKTAMLSPNIGCTYAGMGPDFRVLLTKGRKAAQAYYLLYKEMIPVKLMARELATVMQEFTQSGGVRPFGVSLLIGGVDDEGPALYQVDPSGSYWGWKASAIGKQALTAKTFLEKRYNAKMEVEDAIHTAILTLKEGFEGAVTEENIEIAIIGTDRTYRVLSAQEVRDYVKEVE